MKENGIINKTYKNGYAEVRLMRKTACENCRMCLMPREEMFVKLKIKNKIGAQRGDIVSIEMKNKAIIGASILVYMVPLLLLTFVLIFTYKLKLWICLTASLGTLFLSYVLLFVLDKFIFVKKDGYAPKMDFALDVCVGEKNALKRLLKNGENVNIVDELGVYTYEKDEPTSKCENESSFNKGKGLQDNSQSELSADKYESSDLDNIDLDEQDK